MNPRVFMERTLMRKTVKTGNTGKWPISCVTLHVYNEMALLRKSFITGTTGKWFLSCVTPCVYYEIALLYKALITNEQFFIFGLEQVTLLYCKFSLLICT